MAAAATWTSTLPPTVAWSSNSSTSSIGRPSLSGFWRNNVTKSPMERPSPTSIPAAACATACAPIFSPKSLNRFSGSWSCRVAFASANAFPLTVASTNLDNPASAVARAFSPIATSTPRRNCASPVKVSEVAALAAAQSFFASAPAPSRGCEMLAMTYRSRQLKLCYAQMNDCAKMSFGVTHDAPSLRQLRQALACIRQQDQHYTDGHALRTPPARVGWPIAGGAVAFAWSGRHKATVAEASVASTGAVGGRVV